MRNEDSGQQMKQTVSPEYPERLSADMVKKDMISCNERLLRPNAML